MSGLISSHISFIVFVEYIRAKIVHQSVNDKNYSVTKPDFHTMPNLPCAVIVLIITEINDVTDSQIMLYFGKSDGKAVYPFRTTRIT